MKQLVITIALIAAAVSAGAQSTSPAGVWKTIDDDTKREKSLVRIVETGGVYSGKIEKALDPSTPTDAVCKACTDERKDQPIVGLPIIRDMKASGDDKTAFEGGNILDPTSGKVYKARFKLIDGGQKLEVRGYIGMPMLGRTQTWLRVE